MANVGDGINKKLRSECDRLRQDSTQQREVVQKYAAITRTGFEIMRGSVENFAEGTIRAFSSNIDHACAQLLKSSNRFVGDVNF